MSSSRWLFRSSGAHIASKSSQITQTTLSLLMARPLSALRRSHRTLPLTSQTVLARRSCQVVPWRSVRICDAQAFRVVMKLADSTCTSCINVSTHLRGSLSSASAFLCCAELLQQFAPLQSAVTFAASFEAIWPFESRNTWGSGRCTGRLLHL